MKQSRYGRFFVLLPIFLLGNCTVNKMKFEGRYCSATLPCAPGFVCEQNACVKSQDAAGASNAPDASSIFDAPANPVTIDATVIRTDQGAIATTICGNSQINSGEQCDGTALGNQTCMSLGFDNGTVSCNSDCTFNLSACTKATYVSITVGTFNMGSRNSELCHDKNEDFHQVTLKKNFEIAATETTQQHFTNHMGYNPSAYNSSAIKCPNCPVESVNWYQAAAYCNALSSSRGYNACYDCGGTGQAITCTVKNIYANAAYYSCPGFRLPTEAEWEYAYRAGTTTAVYNGNLEYCDYDLPVNKVAWYANTSDDHPHNVGTKTANAWGVYDMAGNVNEWCHDPFVANLGTVAVTDPFGASGTNSRPIRGGDFQDECSKLRAAFRYPLALSTKDSAVGFRCVRTK